MTQMDNIRTIFIIVYVIFLSRSNGKQQVTAEQPKIQTKFVLDCVVLIYTQQLVVF